MSEKIRFELALLQDDIRGMEKGLAHQGMTPKDFRDMRNQLEASLRIERRAIDVLQTKFGITVQSVSERAALEKKMK